VANGQRIVPCAAFRKKKIEQGLLIRTQGEKWVFSYAAGDDGDEAIFKFSNHALKPGEHLSIAEHDGQQRTFRVALVSDWSPPKK
jgi:hypothetical protein